jgi:hypothetical protein
VSAPSRRLTGVAALAALLVALVGAGSGASAPPRVQAPPPGPVQAALDAVLYTAALLGLCLVAFLAYQLWPRRRRKHPDEPELVHEPPPIHWAVKLALTAVPLVLLGLLITAVVIWTPPLPAGPHPSSAPAAHPGVAPTGAGGAGASRAPAPAGDPWLPLALSIGLVVVSGVLVWAIARRPPAPGPSLRERTEHALVKALGSSLEALRAEPDPRRGVIAAYAAMETSLALDGLPRRPQEAPREYLARLLSVVGPDPQGLRRLTGLFELARFSAHPIDEGMRHRAIQALAAIEFSLAGVPMEGEAASPARRGRVGERV